MPKLSCSVKLLVFKTLFQSPLYSVFAASKEIVDRDKDVVKTPVSNLSGVWESSDDLFSRNASRCLKSNVGKGGQALSCIEASLISSNTYFW
ncbi:hypothetical protein FOQG_18825 [Fusarium oxysporum f. sp. raphani 54005]|uniref:Uncharacterized protein n=1 Tax=Fusarium oxysporum f. sp. raphani 54005 TaxID=1089458 RepID=X0BD57_FUSOX|nr:hypothetical protein FOQG_18825 [Fusarium oxysporum f. sp. raphani 54005]